MRRSGLTLIELLVVVAMMGAMVVIGIPSFKKMVQKARQKEAQTQLAAIFQAESSFFAEWRVYGNNLAGMGYKMEGADDLGRLDTARYLVGFVPAGCRWYGMILYPDRSKLGDSLPGDRVNQRHPAYFLSPHILSWGRSTITGECLESRITDQDFLATATGIIAPNVREDAPLVSGKDTWSIDPQKRLLNVHSGIR